MLTAESVIQGVCFISMCVSLCWLCNVQLDRFIEPHPHVTYTMSTSFPCGFGCVARATTHST